MRKSAGLAFLVTLGACGGAAHEGTTTAAHETSDAWATEACATPGIVYSELDGARRLIVTARDRIVLDASGVHRATTVPADAMRLAAHFGPTDGAWVFVTDGGVVLRSEGFLGAIAVAGALPHYAQEVPSLGAGHLFEDHGRYLLLDESGVRSLPVPEGSIVITAAIDWPGTVALLTEPGVLSVSHDHGASYVPIDVGDRVVTEVAVHHDEIRVRFADRAYATLVDDILSEPREEDDRYEDEEDGYADDAREYADEDRAYGDAEDGYADEESEDADPSAPAPEARVPLDPWCSAIPLDVITHWDASSVPPWSVEELDLPARCQALAGAAVVVAECLPRHPRRGAMDELLWLDPAQGRFRSLGMLPGNALPGASSGAVGAPGSRTFVLRHAMEGPADALFFDGEQLVPITLGERRYPLAVRGALAFVRVSDPHESVSLVHLPDVTTVPLDLPLGLEPLWGTFAADGTVVVVAAEPTREAGDAFALFVGQPGAWARATVAADLRMIGMADARHGLLTTRTSSFATDDGGETWNDLHVVSGYAQGPECSAEGCAVAGVVTYGRARGGEREVIATPPAQRQPTTYADPVTWHCDAPASVQWAGDAAHDLIMSSDGYAVVETDDQPPTIEWWGGDARGAFHGHGTLPGEYLHGLGGLTRTFAILRLEVGLAIGGASPRTVSPPASCEALRTSDLEVTPLPDGGAIVDVSFEGENIGRPHWITRLDADGDEVGSRVVVVRHDAAIGLAVGSNGETGLAVGDDDLTPTRWTIHPLGDGPITSIEAAYDGVACEAPATWTIATSLSAVRMQMRDGYATMAPERVVLGVTDGRACLAAVQPGFALEETGMPMMFAEGGVMRGLTVDDSARGAAMSCAQVVSP